MLAAVTGANGYLGSRISARLREGGWSVLELSNAPARPDQVRFTLLEALEPNELGAADALVHCAYDFRPRRWAAIERMNVEGSRKLLASARAADVETVVQISSTSAFPDARSLYGRAKLAIERDATAVGAHIVRPGLVFAPGAKGVIGSVRRTVERLKVLPVARSRGRAQLVHERDLCDFVVDLVEGKAGPPGEPRIAAHGRGHTLEEIVHTLATALDRRTILVPVPWRVAWLGLRAAESLGATPKLRSDSLLSLATLATQPISPADAPRFRPFTPRTLAQPC